MGLNDLTFYDVIQRNALSFSNNKAWKEIDDNKEFTFSDIKSLTDKLAAGLMTAGVQKGDRVGVLGKNSIEFFLVYGAAAATGAVVLPVNWRLSKEEAVFNLNDCSPVVLFCDEEYQAMIMEAKAGLSTVKKYYNLKGDGGEFSSFSSLLKEAADFTPNDVSENDGFVIIHTAAVHGRPRGALLSHRNLYTSCMQFAYFMQISEKDAHLNVLPLFHVGGLFLAAAAFHFGAANINFSKFDADLAVEAVVHDKASLMFDFSPVLASILESHEKSGRDISSLRAITGLDTPETIEKYQKITGGTFFSMYGQTETSCLSTFGPYNDRPGSAGKPLPCATVVLTDDYDRPVPLGSVGEITVKGPMVFKGYWNLDEDNAHTFRGGRHHTGDLGKFDENGFLFYAGRKAEKELIKPGGENVYPAEVEKAIMAHPALLETVVFGVPDPKWKEGIKAVCVLKPGQSLTAEELIEFVGSKIARYKKPGYVAFVEEIPKQDNGEIDRGKVRELYGNT